MAQIQDFIVKGGLVAQGTNQSTSTLTGALIVGGGVAAGGNANIGGTLKARILPDVDTSVNTANGYGFSLGDIVVVDSATTASGLSVANYIGHTSLNLNTGTSINTAVNVFIAGAPVLLNQDSSINEAWSLYINTGSVFVGESIGNPAGFNNNALQVQGGISGLGGIYVEGGGNFLGSFYLNGAEIITRANQNTGTQYFNAEVIINTVTNSISTTTGALIVRNGGVGIGGNLYLGGYFAALTTGTFLSTQSAISTSTGALRIRGGLGVGGAVWANSATFVSELSNPLAVSGNSVQLINGGGLGVSGTVHIANTSDSALTVAGGADIGGAIFADTITIQNSSSATGYLAAPLVVTGGAYVGANLIVASTDGYALQVNGGATVDGDLTVNGVGSFTNRIEIASTSYISGAQILTTATIPIFAVTSLTAGTDTAVTTSTGDVVVWTTSTLQSVTDRGQTTTNTVNVLNTLSSDNLLVRNDETVNGLVRFTNTETSYSTETGALVVTGGVGVGGSINIGLDSYIGGSKIVTTSTLADYGVTTLLAGTDTAVNTTTGIVTVWNISNLQSVTDRGYSTTNPIEITNQAGSTSTYTGALIVKGGVGIGENAYIGGTLEVSNTATLAGTVRLTNPRNSSTSTDGALIVDGGVGIAKDLFVGGQFVFAGALQISGELTSIGTLRVINTGVSTSTSSGALVVEGGAGITGNLYADNIFANGAEVITTGTIGGYGVAQIIGGTDTSVSSSTGAVIVWNTSTLQTITDRGQTTTNAITILNTLTVNDVNAANVTMAALTATGIIEFQNIEDAISTTGTGAVRIAGGVGVAGNVYAGAVYDDNARAVTTATISQYAVSKLTGGTDTAVSTSTGEVVVWNYSTLQTITERGNSTTVAVSILYTGSDALTVAGGISVETTSSFAQDLNITGNVNAGSLSVQTTSTFNSVEITGVTTVTNVTQSTSTVSGSVILAGGLGVGGNIYADAIYDQDARVLTTATIGDFGVTALQAGTDTAVSSATGVVVVWNTSTLQSVTDRGSETTNAVKILNSLTVTSSTYINDSLEVINTATVGTLYASTTSYVNNSEIVTAETIKGFAVTSLTAGTDTAVSNNLGDVVVWNTSTLETVTRRGATTPHAIRITNTTTSGSYSEGALIVDGGAGIAGNLYVGQNALITGNLVVLGTQTIVDSTSTTIVDPVLDIGAGANNGELIADDLLNKGISVHYFSTATNLEDNMFFGRDEPSGKFVVRHEYGTGRPLNPDYSTSGTYAGMTIGNLWIDDATSATNTYTGALHVVGGASIEQDLWVGGNAFIADALVVTTATIAGFGVTTIVGGTDTAVSTATGVVVVWNTSTLQSVTDRGQTTTNAISIQNTLTVSTDISVGQSINVTTSATVGTELYVTGSASVGNNLTVTNTATIGADLYASKVFDNNNRVITDVTPAGGIAIGISNLQSTGPSASFTIDNLGVTATIGTQFLGVSSSTGEVTFYNLGVNEAYGSTFIGVDNTTGTVTITNLGVTDLVGTDFIGVSTSTGTVTLFNLGVQTLTAGTDTVVSASTGTVEVWNNSTLDSVAGRGHTSTYKIEISNLSASSNFTTGALVVAGGVGIGGNVYINNKSFIENAEIVTTATIDQFAVTVLEAGTDTAVSTSHGIVSVWTTSTLQTVTDRGNSTTNTVIFANTTNVSTSLSTASVLIEGGLGIAKDLRIGGTFFYAGELQISSTTSSTTTDTGALTVAGGVGIGENLNVAGLTKVWNTGWGTGTSALTVLGGVEVANTSYFGDLYINGSVALTDATFKGVADIRAGTDTAVNTETGHVVIWNTSTLQTVTDRGNSTTNAVHITNVTPSTDATTGALVVDGGVGISGNLYGQNLFINNTLNAISGDLFLSAPGSVFANGVDLLAYDPQAIYVSESTGDDTTGDGRRVQSAYKTITKALTVAQSGDAIFVEAGTYQEVFPMTVPAGVSIRGNGLRSTIITPTSGTNQNDAFLLNGETLLCDFTISGFYKPGYAFKFATGAKITTKSPYIERVSVITRGTTYTTDDPYGYNAGDAGNGAYLDASVLDPTSLEPAMLWNEVTFIVPNATGMYMTNGARAELLNGFFYFANKAIDAQAGLTGYGGVGKTRLKMSGVTGTFVGGDTLVYKGPTGNTLASGTIYNVSNGYVYLNGPVWGFETPIDRTPKGVTFYGGAKLSTVQKKYGASSLLISTSTDYVEVLSDSDLQFNASDSYTVESWIYPLTTTSTNQYFFYKGTTSTSAIRMYIDGTGKISASHGSSVITSTGAATLNTWTHVALVRTGGTSAIDLYVNGALAASAPAVLNGVYNTDPVNIGGNGTDAFIGYIEDLRVSNVARYSAGYVPGALINDSATVLMLHFDGANNATSTADDGITLQNVYSTGLNPAAATKIALADYHQFGAELRCIGSAAVFGDKGVIANGTGTDLKLIAFNMSHIGSLGDLSDDVSLTVQSNEVTQTNGGHIYYQTVDQNGDFRVGDHFLVNQRTGDVTFNQGALNLNNISSLSITDGVNSTVITPGNIAVGNVNLAGNTIGSLTGNLTIAPASTLTTIDSNLQLNGSANISQVSYINGFQIITAGTLGSFGVTTLTAGTDTAITTSTGNVVIWTTSTLQTVTDRGSTTSNRVNITNTTSSTSTTTGALTVAGGVGVEGDIRVGGNVYSQGGQPLYSPKVTVSLTPPTTATNNIGDFWIDPSIGVEYQWILDGTNYYWIQFTGV